MGQRWSAQATLWVCVFSGISTGILIGIAQADGVVRDGLGAVSAARGGVNLGYGDNGPVLMDNAAGILRSNGTEFLDVGLDVLVTDLGYSEIGNSENAGNDPFPMGHLAYWRKSEDEVFAAGLGFFAPAGFASVYDLAGPFPLLGPQHYKSIGALARILPAVACQITERLSVGATLGVAVSHVELEGPYFLQSAGPFQGTPTILDLQDTGAALSWSVGFQFQLTDTTLIGVNYQDENRFHLNGNARVDVPLLGATYFDTQLDIVWPRTLGIGVRQDLSECSILGFDLVWFDWSHAFDEVNVAFLNPTNPVFGAILGNRYDERFPLQWRDSVSVRLGYEFFLANDSVLRLGYVYHRNPIPDSTLTTFIQATLEHGVSCGYGFNWDDYQINLAYQFNWGDDRNIGTSGLAGGDFSFSEVQTQAHWLYASLVRPF